MTAIPEVVRLESYIEETEKKVQTLEVSVAKIAGQLEIIKWLLFFLTSGIFGIFFKQIGVF